MIIKQKLKKVIKKHILYNFSFYIYKNINIQKNYEIKKILIFKLIFQY